MASLDVYQMGVPLMVTVAAFFLVYLCTNSEVVMGGSVARDTIDFVGMESAPAGHAPIDPTFECKWRSLAFEYAQKLQPWRGADKFKEVYDSLQLRKCPNATTWDPTTLPYGGKALPLSPPRPLPRGFPSSPNPARVFVDPTFGNDANPGTIALPFKTIARAIVATRSAGLGSSIQLRAVGSETRSLRLLHVVIGHSLLGTNFESECR